MKRLAERSFVVVLLALVAVPTAAAQTVINGSALSHRSSGSGSGNFTLNENGYVGTYFTLAAPGQVTLAVNASGTTNDGTAPQMNIVVADTKVGFEVQNGFNSYQHIYDLPAGTYFARTEFNNDVTTANRQLTISNLTITGATTISNTSDVTTNDANALAAADTYIEHFRQGPANVALSGLAPGVLVDVKMVRSSFNIGTMVQGFNADTFLAPVAANDTTSTAARYQQFVKQYFNILVPSNMGKWAHTQPEPNQLTMENVDKILNFAEANDMNVRMHNLVWGNQQPAFVNDLISQAQSSNPAVSEPAKANLMMAIANRIAYYVGDGDGDTNDGDRSRRYLEIDVVNETLREGTYYDIFGTEGIAQIYKMVHDAVEAAGAETRLYTNEYNVFQFANDPITGATDNYANWYRRHIENINNAGYGKVVDGIGIQLINHPAAHSAARVNQVMHNMAVTGLPVTVTEFSVVPEFNGVETTEAVAAQLYNESLRLTFGHPNGTSFLIWEPWPPATTDPTTIMDANWNLRQAGQALVDLIEAWTTPDQSLVVGANGTIDLNGFYGEYEITIGDQTFSLDLTKGETLYSIVVAPGDFNGDGVVDAGDYTVWRNSLGSSDLRADGNGDRVIDEQDYTIWKNAYGSSYAFGAGQFSTTVPEPCGTALIVLAALSIAAGQWRRQPYRATSITASNAGFGCNSRSNRSG